MAAADAPSIVVFTRGRPAFVHRLARYYGDYPGQLVVVDGSVDPVTGLRMPARGEYLHRPGMSVHGRIAEGMSRVTAPACSLAADDDYQVHSGLIACGRAIDADPGIACAAGTVVYFAQGERAPGRAIADSAVERILELPVAGGPAGRFRDFISLGPQVLYACVRTSVARRLADALADLPDEDGLVGEQLWGAIPALFGRTRFVDRLQLCRRRADRDYGDYLAPFKALGDIAEWHGFGRFGDRFRALAREAGADAAGADAVIDAWREFAAETARGQRAWRDRTFPAAVRARRVLRNAMSAVGVAASPRAWVDASARSIARNAAARVALRSRAYPWSDADARAEYERIMAFDERSAAGA
jgi:glycosyltransferase domain-containing protein